MTNLLGNQLFKVPLTVYVWGRNRRHDNNPLTPSGDLHDRNEPCRVGQMQVPIARAVDASAPLRRKLHLPAASQALRLTLDVRRCWIGRYDELRGNSRIGQSHLSFLSMTNANPASYQKRSARLTFLMASIQNDRALGHACRRALKLSPVLDLRQSARTLAEAPSRPIRKQVFAHQQIES